MPIIPRKIKNEQQNLEQQPKSIQQQILDSQQATDDYLKKLDEIETDFQRKQARSAVEFMDRLDEEKRRKEELYKEAEKRAEEFRKRQEEIEKAKERKRIEREREAVELQALTDQINADRRKESNQEKKVDDDLQKLANEIVSGTRTESVSSKKEHSFSFNPNEVRDPEEDLIHVFKDEKGEKYGITGKELTRFTGREYNFTSSGLLLPIDLERIPPELIKVQEVPKNDSLSSTGFSNPSRLSFMRIYSNPIRVKTDNQFEIVAISEKDYGEIMNNFYDTVNQKNTRTK